MTTPQQSQAVQEQPVPTDASNPPSKKKKIILWAGVGGVATLLVAGLLIWLLGGKEQGDGNTQSVAHDAQDGGLSEIVRFGDTNLKSKVCEALGKPKGIMLTRKNLASLENLEAFKAEITDLSGLENASNLIKLELYNNQITDLTPLAGLTNLTKLHLEDNLIPLDQMAMLRKALPNCKIYFMRPFRP